MRVTNTSFPKHSKLLQSITFSGSLYNVTDVDWLVNRNHNAKEHTHTHTHTVTQSNA